MISLTQSSAITNISSNNDLTISQNTTAALIKSPVDVDNKVLLSDRTITVNTTKIANKDTNNCGFASVTARIKPQEFAEITQKLELITQNEVAEVQYLCSNPQAINCEKKDFFLNDNFPYIVLKALQQNYISTAEFATLASLHAVVLELMGTNNGINDNQLPVVFTSLFNADNSYNQNAWDKLKTPITHLTDPNSIVDINLDKAISVMQQTMTTKTPIEAGYWTFIAGYKYCGRNLNNISYRFSLMGVNLFLNLNRRLSILPSMSIRQEFLNAAFAEISCNMNPVIGVSKVIDLRNGALIRSRDFAIPFPAYPLPKEADSFAAPQIVDFQHHDAYHALRISMLPQEHVEFYIAIGDLLADISKTFLINKQDIKELIEKKVLLVNDLIQALDSTTKNTAITLLNKKLYGITQLISAIDNTRRALGRFKFLMYDLDIAYTEKQHPQNIKSYGKIGYYLINIASKVNSDYIFNNKKFLENFFFKITAKAIIECIYKNYPDITVIFTLVNKIYYMFVQRKQNLLTSIPNASTVKQKKITSTITQLDRSIKFLQLQQNYLTAIM